MAEEFPENLWDRLLLQTEITLNLLQQSNATPNVSAYAHLSGPFDYNKIPLAPMGCAAQIHKKSDKRGTWQYHSVDGWYLYTLHVTKSLSNACMPHRNHKKGMSHQHSRLSTQTNHKSDHYTCRQSHACNTTGNKRNKETGWHQKFARSTRPPTTCQQCKQLPTNHRSPQHSASSKGETHATGNQK